VLYDKVNAHGKSWVELVGFDQWRRQDLLPGGAKLETRSWGTHGELQGRPGAAAAR